MKYEIISPDAVKQELWKEDTIFTLTGGYTLDLTNLPGSLTYLPKGSMLNINHTTRTAKLVKTAKVYANVAADGVAIPVYKTHALKVGDILAKSLNGTAYAITAIDSTSSADYDTVTVGTTLGALTAGDVLFEAAAETADAAAEKAQAMCLASFEVKIEGIPSVTVIIAAMEVKEAKLPYPVHALNKASLTERFYWI